MSCLEDMLLRSHGSSGSDQSVRRSACLLGLLLVTADADLI
jgi:hypothetical protein